MAIAILVGGLDKGFQLLCILGDLAKADNVEGDVRALGWGGGGWGGGSLDVQHPNTNPKSFAHALDCVFVGVDRTANKGNDALLLLPIWPSL